MVKKGSYRQKGPISDIRETRFDSFQIFNPLILIMRDLSSMSRNDLLYAGLF